MHSADDTRTFSFDMEPKRKYISIGVRKTTKRKLDDFARRKRLALSEAADLGADALGVLSKEQLDALIERRPEVEPAAPAA